MAEHDEEPEIEFPESDVEFDAFAAKLLEFAEGHIGELGLAAEDVGNLRAAHNKWRESWAAADKAEADAERAAGRTAAAGQRLVAEQAALRTTKRSRRDNPSFPH